MELCRRSFLKGAGASGGVTTAGVSLDVVAQAARTTKASGEGVKPALKGADTVDGKPVRTGFQVFADGVKGITPQYAQDVSGVLAATVVRLAQMFAKEACIGETIEIDDEKLRYRPVSLYCFRGFEAKEFDRPELARPAGFEPTTPWFVVSFRDRLMRSR